MQMPKYRSINIILLHQLKSSDRYSNIFQNIQHIRSWARPMISFVGYMHTWRIALWPQCAWPLKISWIQNQQKWFHGHFFRGPRKNVKRRSEEPGNVQKMSRWLLFFHWVYFLFPIIFHWKCLIESTLNPFLVSFYICKHWTL